MIIMVTVKATVMLNSQRAQWGQGREKKEILQILKKWAFVHWSCSGAGSGIVIVSLGCKQITDCVLRAMQQHGAISQRTLSPPLLPGCTEAKSWFSQEQLQQARGVHGVPRLALSQETFQPPCSLRQSSATPRHPKHLYTQRSVLPPGFVPCAGRGVSTSCAN